ncbi:probable inactive nicotinamidase, partial [Tanacetum coccineum]
MLLEEWLNMESGFGELGDIELVHVKLPKKLKKRRQIEIDDGAAGYVEKLVIIHLFCHMICALICSWLIALLSKYFYSMILECTLELARWSGWVTGVQTPNCIRQTIFDAIGLDYKSVTVIVDATTAATPDVHA